jgi:uncharacterized protein (TIGR00297 family)
MQFLLGLALAAVVSSLAFRLGSLSRSGALAATAVGTIIFGAGGWRWAVLLLAFFISSSVLTQLFRSRKAAVSANFDKGGPRDAGQVLGNGAIATIFAGLTFFFPHALWPWIGFAASLAAVNADTWSTELGVLSRGRPRLITNLKPVEKGTSGGVSLVGVLAALAGAALIALLAVLLNPFPGAIPAPERWSLIAAWLLTGSGLLGALFDSLVGATVQAMYFCPLDKKETERHPLHTCGTPTVHIRGWRWLRNDGVNFLCGLLGAAIALLATGAGGLLA